VHIALLGMGNVGTGTLKILDMNKDKIFRKTNTEINVKKVFVKNIDKRREFSLPGNVITSDIDEILNDPDIDILVELMGGLEPAYSYIKRALQSGKSVVTANKALIATYGQELTSLALANGVAIKYEASVAGGIPIINILSSSLAGNEFSEITGIINGTTNYILTKMTENHMEYAQALTDAQALGFAEADPSSDILGVDVAFKLSILAREGFDFQISPQVIPTEGINNISKDDIEYASEFGYKIKLLAAIRKYDNNIECHVGPTLIPASHPLSSVSNEYNALLIKGNAISDMMVYGKGAGAMPTGSAVVGDIIDILVNSCPNGINETSYNDLHSLPTFNFIGEGSSMYYLNFIVEDLPGVLGRISTCFGDYGISIDSVIQRSSSIRSDGFVSVVYILHECFRETINKATVEMSSYDFIHEIRSPIRVSPLK